MVGEVCLDVPYRLGPDERPCQLAQRAACSDDLDLRRIELADQLHDRHGVREQRAFAVLAHDAPGRDVARRRAVDEDGLARLDQLERRLGDALLRVDDHLEPLEERVLVTREARQHRAAVRAARDAAPLELVEVAARGHRRDAELGLEGGHRHAAVLAQALGDQPPPLVREHGASRVAHAPTRANGPGMALIYHIERRSLDAHESTAAARDARRIRTFSAAHGAKEVASFHRVVRGDWAVGRKRISLSDTLCGRETAKAMIWAMSSAVIAVAS